MSIAKDNKNKRFYITFKYKDKQGNYHTKNIRNKERTFDVGKKYMQSIEKEVIRKTLNENEITIDTLIDKFYRVREAEDKSPVTLYQQEQILKRLFANYLNKDLYVNDFFGVELADNLKIDIATMKLSASTQNVYLTTLRTFVTFAKKRKYCERELADDMLDLLENVKVDKVKKTNFFVNGEEDLRKFEATFNETDNEYYLPLMTIFYGALRIGEFQALKVSDFNSNEHSLSITKQYNENIGLVNHTKTKCDRVVYLPSKFSEMLQNYINSNNLTDNDCLFKKIIARATLNNIFQKHLKLANLEHITLHGLRHSFATRMFDKGYDVKEVQEQLGHKDMNTTMSFYIHYTRNKNKHDLDDLM